eukprot:2595959-Karenia_brevis.AAC.1
MQPELRYAMLGTLHLAAAASRMRAPSNTSMCVTQTLEARHAATGTITDASIVDMRSTRELLPNRRLGQRCPNFLT